MAQSKKQEKLEAARSKSDILAQIASGERERPPRHPSQQLRPESRAGGGQVKDLHATVLGRGLAPNQAPRLQPVDQSRDVRSVTGQRVGEPAHWQRSPGLDQVQHVALDRGEIELGARRRQVRSLREEEFHEELPGPTGALICRIHARNYT